MMQQDAPAVVMDGSEAVEAACTVCGQYYDTWELHGGMCDTCAMEASPPYLDLVKWVAEQQDAIHELQARVKALEGIVSQQARMGI